MKTEKGYHIDENGNKWNESLYTLEQAKAHSKSLINCFNCINCSDCRSCRSCSDCSDCSDFKVNPQRITSPILGSRNSQTTIYFNEDRLLVVSGCFKGTMEEFKKAIENTHGDNQFSKDYFNWIKKVESYIQS